jgi:RimJ/RimL family protein N-acetyltransferase
MTLILETERLLLRPPQAADIGHFVPLLNDFDVSRNLSRVPHPYTEDDGCAFVVKAADQRARGEHFTFAVLRKTDTAFIGMCGVHPALGFEMGYWLGKPYWGQGYATEAAWRVAVFAFEVLAAERLVAAGSKTIRRRPACWPNWAFVPHTGKSASRFPAGTRFTVT